MKNFTVEDVEASINQDPRQCPTFDRPFCKNVSSKASKNNTTAKRRQCGRCS